MLTGNWCLSQQGHLPSASVFIRGLATQSKKIVNWPSRKNKFWYPFFLAIINRRSGKMLIKDMHMWGPVEYKCDNFLSCLSFTMHIILQLMLLIAIINTFIIIIITIIRPYLFLCTLSLQNLQHMSLTSFFVFVII